MKKWMLILGAAAALSLTGCGGNAAESGGQDTASLQTEAAKTEEGNAAEGVREAETMEEAAEASLAGTGEADTEAGDSASAELQVREFEDLFHSFALKDLDGNEVTEAVFQDADLTLVNIWGTFCGPCIEEMPELGALAGEYREAGTGVQIIGLVIDTVTGSEDGKRLVSDPALVETAEEIVAQTGADYLHLLPEGEFAYSLLMSGKAQSVPTSVFVDSKGNIVGRTVMGARKKDNWKTIIAERLQEVKEAEG